MKQRLLMFWCVFWLMMGLGGIMDHITNHPYKDHPINTVSIFILIINASVIRITRVK